jgi:para-nitrobenzyl esterase
VRVRSWRITSSAVALTAALTGCHPGTDTIAITREGPVKGTLTGNVRLFQGIPYAAPPTGPNRFAPPKPVEPWGATIRAATAPGSPCPQLLWLPPVPPAPIGKEDCLTLNVTAGLGPDSGVPVMVWIHGGGFTTGAGSIFAAQWLAKRGIIVVTINYRLGILGFLANQEFDSSSNGRTGNWGIEDQIAALQWVHRNIEAFGGDPGNVTIAGESAGSFSVCALITNAKKGGDAKGLFVRAIAQSGPCQFRIGTLAVAKEFAIAISGALCSGKSGALLVSCLRGLPPETVVSLQNILPPGATWPSVGGHDVPVQPREAIGFVPMMLGGNKYEWAPFIGSGPGQIPAPKNETEYNAALQKDIVYGPTLGQQVRDAPQYPHAGLDNNPLLSYLALARAMSDFAPGDPVSLCYDVVNWQKHKSQNVIYAYEFSYSEGPFGAWHAAELPYLFPGTTAAGTPANPQGAALSGAAGALSSEMILFWANFVANGDPNGPPGTWLRHWPPYSGPSDVLLFGGPTTTGNVDAEHHCTDFWMKKLPPGYLD